MVSNTICNTVSMKEIAPWFIVTGCEIENERYVVFNIGDTIGFMWRFSTRTVVACHEDEARRRRIRRQNTKKKKIRRCRNRIGLRVMSLIPY